ncbi:MAG: tail fiber protein [Demequinaceae bacterium]|nr:tail fiber protein [Demequinaceae bacterium]
MRADGRLLSIQAYNALFAVLGTMYGGDGASTFAIPNLADQAPDGTTYTICTSGVFPQRY